MDLGLHRHEASPALKRCPPLSKLTRGRHGDAIWEAHRVYGGLAWLRYDEQFRQRMSDLVVSPLGVVPKKERGKFRLIHHLSFPRGRSVNDGIDKGLSSVSYTSFDFAPDMVREAGPGALMAKTDIESAFRLLLVHPDSLYLLGFFEGGYYVDRCLPMGCSISCAYFEAFSSFLEWVVRERAGMGSVTHYLDDFLCVGPAGTRVCDLLLATMLNVFGAFGVPVAHDKTEGPATVIKFLGIEIDTVKRVCRLPRDKIEDLVGGVGGGPGGKEGHVSAASVSARDVELCVPGFAYGAGVYQASITSDGGGSGTASLHSVDGGNKGGHQDVDHFPGVL
ncbi:LOW QUALITY PROTEIN: uncharacterized protein PAF06_020242 [Gastrophryne carolinensis]